MPHGGVGAQDSSNVIGAPIFERYVRRVRFELLSTPRLVERIAIGRQIRVIERLREAYGRGRWRKLKGIAAVRLTNGRICWAEVHWYEADGVGRREMKIKRLLDERDPQ